MYQPAPLPTRISEKAKRIARLWLLLLEKRTKESHVAGLPGAIILVLRQGNLELFHQLKTFFFPQVQKNLKKYQAMVRRWM